VEACVNDRVVDLLEGNSKSACSHRPHSRLEPDSLILFFSLADRADRLSFAAAPEIPRAASLPQT